ncbi:IclR family transcriptional regulator [Evansella sp. LMS18]|uniref:IclR family transcriptional regulator n=1 Tax=Evansella sp. LMS18 TaxID=2924033 RepID=UPI0020D16C05|nr:IclR family transcriptional regulator [Evansella sp. LMS18]UTR12109.1 IclR family transcriptional regulator [Evansella sp. LMS18]
MSESSKRNSSIEKALIVLSCFSEQNFALTLEDISKMTNIPRSTLFRILTSLEEYRYIKKNLVSNKTWYTLGYTFLEKGQMVHRHSDIREHAKEEMTALRNEVNLNVQLAIQEGLDALYIEQIPSWRPVRLYPAIGRRAPLYAAACPRILLAYLDEKEQTEVLNRLTLKKFTPFTPVERQGIEKSLREIRKNGYSLSYGELFEGTLAFAVPVFYPNTSKILASLSIVGLENNYDKNFDYYISLLKETAGNIEKRLLN